MAIRSIEAICRHNCTLFEPASFDYSTIPGFSRSEQEAAIKAINKLVLCSMPLPTGTVAAFPEDNCRRVATKNEYQGTAAVHLKDMYGGDGLPNATSFTTNTYVEPSWSVAGIDAVSQRAGASLPGLPPAARHRYV